MPWDNAIPVLLTALPLISGFLLYLHRRGGHEALAERTLQELNTYLRTPDGRWKAVLREELDSEVTRIFKNSDLSASRSSGGYSTLINQLMTSLNQASGELHARINALTKEHGDDLGGVQSDLRLLREGMNTLAKIINTVEGHAASLLSKTDKGEVHLESLRKFKDVTEARLQELDRRFTVIETTCRQRHQREG